MQTIPLFCLQRRLTQCAQSMAIMLDKAALCFPVELLIAGRLRVLLQENVMIFAPQLVNRNLERLTRTIGEGLHLPRTIPRAQFFDLLAQHRISHIFVSVVSRMRIPINNCVTRRHKQSSITSVQQSCDIWFDVCWN